MIRKLFYSLLLYACAFFQHAGAQQIKILFDATKAEMAGNADWVIDADLHNIGSNSAGSMVPGFGNESNPQRFPTPAQSGITSSTPETYWEGSLSNWAIDLVKHGYEVETLPYNVPLTYGNLGNVQDLSNYKVFIVDEPNIQFTSSEKTALVNFVQNGGGLFMISDHTISDRNGDGWDSPAIWNDLFSSNGIQANPFGITFDLQNYSQTTSNIANLPGDSCLHGPMGSVVEIQYSNGTSMTLNPAVNASVKGLIYKTGASNTGNTQVFFARARYGNGKVCALGDSSPPDDGTGDPNDQLYTSYIAEALGSHQKLLVNATIWLASADSITTSVDEFAKVRHDFLLYPNPSSGKYHFRSEESCHEILNLVVTDLAGKVILTKESGFCELDLTAFESGIYFYRVTSKNEQVLEGKLVKE